MPETDIEIQQQKTTDSVVAPTPAVVETVTESVVPDSTFLVAETAIPVPTDTVAEWRPVRKQRVDTCYISAFDFPKSAMDTTYLDSCLREEMVSAPDVLLNPPHVPVSAEELAYDSIFARLTNVSDTIFVGSNDRRVSVKEIYKGFDGISHNNTLHGQFWFLPLMFVLFFGYGMVFSMRSKSLSRDAKDFFSNHGNRATSSHPGEQKTSYRFAVNMLGVLSLAMFSLQSFILVGVKHAPHSFVGAALSFIVLTLGYVVFKQLSALYMGYVFFDKGVRREWSQAFLYLFSTLGIFLFPMTLCLTYAPAYMTQWFVGAGVIAAGIAEMLLIWYDIKRFFKNKFSILYLFLYLCTLEILPLSALLAGYYSLITTI